MAKNDILVFLPTYNEAGHVEEMRRRIQAIGAPVDIMFLDDNSTDGTGEMIDMFAAEDETVLAVHRPGKEGIGGAHLEGHCAVVAPSGQAKVDACALTLQQHGTCYYENDLMQHGTCFSEH